MEFVDIMTSCGKVVRCDKATLLSGSKLFHRLQCLVDNGTITSPNGAMYLPFSYADIVDMVGCMREPGRDSPARVTFWALARFVGSDMLVERAERALRSCCVEMRVDAFRSAYLLPPQLPSSDNACVLHEMTNFYDDVYVPSVSLAKDTTLKRRRD